MKECNVLWGGSATSWAEPILEDARNVTFIPFAPGVFFSEDNTWGIFSSDGSLIKGAAYYRGPGPELIGQSHSTTLHASSRLLTRADTVYIYGGPVIPHFGHWLLSSICRLWPLIKQPRSPFKIIWHASHQPAEWFANVPYARAILNGLGLGPEDFIVPTEAVVIDRLLIPHPSFIEQHSANRYYSKLCRLVGSKMLHERAACKPSRKTYISKSKLKSGVSRISNESMLDDEFSRRGFDIIYPEQMSVVDQLSVLSQSRVVAGVAGSAFHLITLLDPIDKIVILSPTSFINSNFRLLDKISGNNPTYINLSDHIEITGAGEGFDMSYRLRDVGPIVDLSL